MSAIAARRRSQPRPRILPRQRSALADATVAAGATLILLFSTDAAHGGRLALVAGILLVLVGAMLLWGTPRPNLRARMLASVAGLFLGFGAATFGTLGAWVAFAAGVALLAGVWRAVA